MSARSQPGPILVTGAHRSGTTWVGKMLALAPGTGYLHEPFSPVTDPGVSAAPFERFFTYLTAENEARYRPALERTLAFRYDWRAQLPRIRGARAAGRTLRDAAAFARARRRHARPVMKDPIALLSAPWLADNFHMDVVLTVRHPAGFAGSIRRLDWSFPFEAFLGDPRLAAFEPELQGQLASPGDFITRAGLLWRVLYTLVDRYRTEHPDWIVVRHEDLSREPLPGFERLYAALGLELTPAAAREISSHSAPTVAPVRHPSPHKVRMDSAATIGNWRDRLTGEELRRLEANVRDVSRRFYADDEW